jgi:hypothetical protein
MSFYSLIIQYCIIYTELSGMDIKEDIRFLVGCLLFDTFGKWLAKGSWSWVGLITIILAEETCGKVSVYIDI